MLDKSKNFGQNEYFKFIKPNSNFLFNLILSEITVRE